MNQFTDLEPLEMVKEFIDPTIFMIIPALWFLGVVLKSTPKFPDWLIVWVLIAIGVLLSMSFIGFDIFGLVQGILATAVAVLGYDLFNQTKEGIQEGAK